MSDNLFEDLSTDPTKVQAYAPQTISRVLKCNQANEMLLSKTDNVYKQNGLLAGDSILTSSWLRPISLSAFHWQTDDQYDSWEKATSKLKEKSGWGLEQFFMNEDSTVNYQKALVEIQKAIDEGKTWIVPARGQGRTKGEVVAEHPFLKK